jgi:N-acyl homoserine lactone hydrolase
MVFHHHCIDPLVGADALEGKEVTVDQAAPQRLYLMQVATIVRSPMEVPIPCYLIQISDGTNVLIDSGLAAGIQPPPGITALNYGQNVLEQLAGFGLRPADINMLICTHFDADHTGYHRAFENAEFVVQRRHYELARGGYPRFAQNRSAWDLPAARYRLVDGDTTLLPGLDLIETSGHVPGHQSVLVRLPQTGPVLLAIDAVAVQSAFTPDRAAAPVDDDEESLRASTRKLLDLARRIGAKLVVFGHDAQQWHVLKKAPEYYD